MAKVFNEAERQRILKKFPKAKCWRSYGHIFNRPIGEGGDCLGHLENPYGVNIDLRQKVERHLIAYTEAERQKILKVLPKAVILTKNRKIYGHWKGESRNFIGTWTKSFGEAIDLTREVRE